MNKQKNALKEIKLRGNDRLKENLKGLIEESKVLEKEIENNLKGVKYE